jgi:hypothetical protein
MPAWVKAIWLVVAIVIIFLVVSLLFGADHGPGRHGG